MIQKRCNSSGSDGSSTEGMAKFPQGIVVVSGENFIQTSVFTKLILNSRYISE